MKIKRFLLTPLALAFALSANVAFAQAGNPPPQGDGANRLTPQQREQVRQIMQGQRAETQQKLAGVLTPEQMAAWQAKRAEREQQHMGGPGGHRGPGSMGGQAGGNPPPPPPTGN